ncbi:MAG: ABC transporter ATP-binding protein [Armatimonadota bacterium]|nr:ABC transporter ATP-binding protein [Armatimonadota bacterium]
MLRVSGLAAGYGMLEVLKDVTAEVGDREVVTLLGPNGAGKTTLFRAVAGQIKPMRGRIDFGGHDLTRLSIWQIARLGIGYVPEGRQLFGTLTVADNLDLGSAHARPAARRYRRQQMDFAFALFPILGERQRQLAGTLSGGQQQMLAIARAIMARPQFLILDEPSLGLAPQVVRSIFQAVRAIHDEGVGVLLIEQNATALTISDRVYVMERGRIVLSKRAAEVNRAESVQRFYLGGATPPVTGDA